MMLLPGLLNIRISRMHKIPRDKYQLAEFQRAIIIHYLRSFDDCTDCKFSKDKYIKRHLFFTLVCADANKYASSN